VYRWQKDIYQGKNTGVARQTAWQCRFESNRQFSKKTYCGKSLVEKLLREMTEIHNSIFTQPSVPK